jgi:hypothetical protein
MELVTIGLGLLVNTCVKNQAVNTAIDDFVTDSVKWVKGWFGKSNKASLIQKLQDEPESEEVKAEVNVAMNEMIKNDHFKIELEKWINESKKENPSIKNVITKKNVIEDANLEIEGNIKIGDKSEGQNNFDEKNTMKNVTIKGGGDFTLGDG